MSTVAFVVIFVLTFLAVEMCQSRNCYVTRTSVGLIFRFEYMHAYVNNVAQMAASVPCEKS